MSLCVQGGSSVATPAKFSFLAFRHPNGEEIPAVWIALPAPFLFACCLSRLSPSLGAPAGLKAISITSCFRPSMAEGRPICDGIRDHRSSAGKLKCGGLGGALASLQSCHFPGVLVSNAAGFGCWALDTRICCVGSRKHVRSDLLD